MLKRKIVSYSVISVCLSAGLIAPLNVHKASAQEITEKYASTVSPTPQVMKEIGQGFPLNPKVGLVTEKGTDAAALSEVIATLKAAGVKEIVQSDINDSIPETPVTIWLGQFIDPSEAAVIKKNVGIDDWSNKNNEGYFLYSGEDGVKKNILIAGHDGSGTFYGAETLKQMIVKRTGTDWVPEVQINDWPTMPKRGTIEGFYGTPWSFEDRLSQLNFYGAHKMNSYIYAPKDDPYHRDQWRTPYPQDKINQIAQLVKTAQQNHVTFTFAISPGTSVVYSSQSDLQALINKAQAMWDIGVRSFAIFLDDIDPNLKDPGDKAMFGNDINPSAAAQAYLLNSFNEKFIKTHPGAERLITVPTDYYQAGTTPYRTRFAALVNPDIVVQWTGIGVVAPTITTADADKIHGIFQHDLLIWDNYPVNDYNPNRLFLGPLVGRDAGLATGHGVIGLTANPMIEAEASKIPLFTVADYTWNPEAYNPEHSINNSIKEFAGPAADALKVFVETSYANSINSNQEPLSEELKPLINQFWTAYDAKDAEAAADKLLTEFDKFKNTPAELRDKLDNKNFLNEVDPFLNKMELYGKAGEAAVKMLLAKEGNNTQAVAEQKAILDNTMTELNQIPQQLSVGVLPAFLDRAINGPDLAQGKTATASSSEVSWLTPDLAVDGNENTRWSSLYNDNEWISVDLGQVQSINKVVLDWESAYGKQYKIQISQDGQNWTDIYTETNGNGGTDQITFNPVQARYVKMQGVQRATGWGYSLYEFKVYNTIN